MNQQTDSSFANDSSATSTSTLSPAVTLTADPAAPAETPLAKAATHKSPARASARKAALASKRDDRCRHYTVAGRRCRNTVLDRASGLCFRHVGRPFQPTDEDLSSAFVGLSGFRSAAEIHSFLSQLTVLLVQNRVSTRRAAILAYLGNTLLRTLHAADLEDTAEPQGFIFDLPRPKRD